MKIIVDAFGGDNAPLEIMKGCECAVEEFGAEIILAGDEKKINETAQKNGISLKNIKILHAPRVMDMEAQPTSILKENSDTSIAVGLKALADGEGDAFVSAGSTGAVIAGATFIVKRIKGIKRTAIGTVLPTAKGPAMLMDCGANAECRAEMLDQFAVMGNIYMREIFDIKEPRVGLVNIGAEETKGDALRLEAYDLMKNSGAYAFAGNVEARDIYSGDYDVVVADGFTGNVILKLSEGVSKFIMGNLKAALMQNFKSKICALLIKKELYSVKKKLDYKEYGGAMVVGVRKTVVKAHGSSDAKAIKNAIRQAMSFTEKDVIGRISSELEGKKEV